MNNIRIAGKPVISSMHTNNFLTLSTEDMRLIAGGISDSSGELPTLPPVRNNESAGTTGEKTTEQETVPQVEPPGLNIARMMGKTA